MSNRRTIKVVGDGEQYEYPAHEALYPGMLVELLSTGKVRKQATDEVDAEILVAMEDNLQGNGIEDAYAEDDRVLCRAFAKGQAVLLILKDGEDVDIGDWLEAAAGGLVKKYTSGVKLAKALEAIDASGTAGLTQANRRLACRVG
jgi:hypothetical protein